MSVRGEFDELLFRILDGVVRVGLAVRRLVRGVFANPSGVSNIGGVLRRAEALYGLAYPWVSGLYFVGSVDFANLMKGGASPGDVGVWGLIKLYVQTKDSGVLYRAFRRMLPYIQSAAAFVADDFAPDLVGVGKTTSALYYACVPYIVSAAAERKNHPHRADLWPNRHLAECVDRLYSYGLVVNTEADFKRLVHMTELTSEGIHPPIPVIVIDDANIVLPRAEGPSEVVAVSKRFFSIYRGITGPIFLTAPRMHTLPTQVINLTSKVAMVSPYGATGGIHVRWFRVSKPYSTSPSAMLTPAIYPWLTGGEGSQVRTVITTDAASTIRNTTSYRELMNTRSIALSRSIKEMRARFRERRGGGGGGEEQGEEE